MGNVPPIALTAPPHVRPPLLSHAAKPIAHGYSLKGEYSDRDGTRRTDTRSRCCGTTPTPPRNDIYIVANMGVANGSHVARVRAGAIRAKEKDERGGHFHRRLTYGSTTTSRSRMSPQPVFETGTIKQPRFAYGT
ncbi:hypothetical protein DFH08DRAFT_957026 [Mycena albidolilacea]|uniref:Uncharacterized protein n=1 Tax=Mycena albidolilacea TaxID=1033008 RepID=A0AAD7A8L8_9AGAR|nr:hypothetical protein DFH08DRAFT_957026 [Mycena albidolilacea]